MELSLQLMDQKQRLFSTQNKVENTTTQHLYIDYPYLNFLEEEEEKQPSSAQYMIKICHLLYYPSRWGTALENAPQNKIEKEGQ